MFHVVPPDSLKSRPIRVVEDTITVPQTFDKLTIIHVTQWVLRAGHTSQKPNVLAHAVL